MRDGGTGVRYRDLARDREFSALFAADVASRIGSQLGKFALAALVYERTRSAGLAAVTFAITYLPGLLGGPVLSTLADRLPRKPLLVTCDLIRAVLVAAIALLDMPIGAALGLLLVVELVKVPFGAARMAILADVLTGDRFAVGNALVGASQQAVQVIGLGAGGFVVVGLGARGALLTDTVSYVLSALLIASLIRRRPAPGGKDGRVRLVHDTLEGLRVVGRTRQLPSLFWLLFLGPTVLATAEGLAMPYAFGFGSGGERLAGFFLASAPLGSVLGLMLVGRMSVRGRERTLLPLSFLVGLAVAAAGVLRTPIGVIGALFVAGVAMGHIAHLQASIVGLVSPQLRGRVIGLANTVLQIGQAGAILLAGLAATTASLRTILVVSGAAAGVAVVGVGLFGAPHAGRHRADRRTRRAARGVPVSVSLQGSTSGFAAGGAGVPAAGSARVRLEPAIPVRPARRIESGMVHRGTILASGEVPDTTLFMVSHDFSRRPDGNFAAGLGPGLAHGFSATPAPGRASAPAPGPASAAARDAAPVRPAEPRALVEPRASRYEAGAEPEPPSYKRSRQVPYGRRQRRVEPPAEAYEENAREWHTRRERRADPRDSGTWRSDDERSRDEGRGYRARSVPGGRRYDDRRRANLSAM